MTIEPSLKINNKVGIPPKSAIVTLARKDSSGESSVVIPLENDSASPCLSYP
jgi:hypothetical protein